MDLWVFYEGLALFLSFLTLFLSFSPWLRAQLPRVLLGQLPKTTQD